MEHELSHIRKAMYPCMDPSCHYPPFPTAQAMKAHAKAHHEVPAPRKSIRRPVPRTSTSLPLVEPLIEKLSRNASSASKETLDKTVSPMDLVASTEIPRRSSGWIPGPGRVKKPVVWPYLENFDNILDKTPSLPPSISPASTDFTTIGPLPLALSYLSDDDPASPPPAGSKRLDELASGMKRSEKANGLFYDKPPYRLPELLFQRGEDKAFSSSMASHTDEVESDEIEKPWEHDPAILDVSQNSGAEQSRWTAQSSQSFKATETNPLHPAGTGIDSEPSELSDNHHYPSGSSWDRWILPPEVQGSDDPSGKMAPSSWRDAEISAPHLESPPENVEQPNHSVQDYQMQLMLLEQQKKQRAILLQTSDTAGPGSIQQSDMLPNIFAYIP